MLSQGASRQLLDIKEDMLALLLESIQNESVEIEGADSFWNMAERRQDMEEVPSVTEALTLRQEGRMPQTGQKSAGKRLRS